MLKPSSSSRRLRFVLLASIACALLAGRAGPAQADDALLIGNSFTAGIPKVVEAIAKAKGKAFGAQGVTPGGKNWKYHLGSSATAKALAEKKWGWVVLQDLSTEPTHVGNVTGFMADGETFYKKVREAAPQATIVLYETWAYEEGHAVYGAQSSANKFANPAEMTGELVKNYSELAGKLENLEPGNQVVLAPVGAAFAHCRELYPDVKLYGPDKKHPNEHGHYLSALVIYATLYEESPIGTEATPGVKVTKDVAAKLQKAALDTVNAWRAAHEKAPLAARAAAH